MNKADASCTRVIACLSCAFVLGLGIPVRANGTSPPGYTTQIAPLFQQKCLSCHSRTTQMGGLVMDSYEAVMRGGDHGSMVVPGKAEASLMVKMLEGKVQPLMPFGADPLPPATIATIRAWIDAGANGPTAAAIAPPPAPIEPDLKLQPAHGSLISGAQKPYASIDHDTIAYVGPGRTPDYDLRGSEVRIGLMAPLQGPRKAEGEAMVLAARLALEDHGKTLPDGQQPSLTVGDESGPWGRASSEIVRLVSDDNAVAIVTSTDGGVAHLAEQVGNKIGVAIVTLAPDSTTTQIDLPWIFRLPADDRREALALAREIYARRGMRKVVLVAERDHDGRAGATEFVRAVLALGAPEPARVDLDASGVDLAQLVGTIRSRGPDAVVVWTDNPLASRLVNSLEGSNDRSAIFLCQKAAAGGIDSAPGGTAWTVSRSGANSAAQASFVDRFRSRAGRLPSTEAAATYDALSLVLTALHQAGSNRARLRDQLARTLNFAGVSGGVAFDGAGNNLVPIDVVALTLSGGRALPAGH
jgi:branched-chain amino acid transport system substrate-binding protein